MTIQFETTFDEKLLKIRTWGMSEEFDQVSLYIDNLLMVIDYYKPRLLLVDERQLREGPEMNKKYTPDDISYACFPTKPLKTALLRSDALNSTEKFWNSSPINQFLRILIFTEVDSAMNWLLTENVL